LWRFLRVRNASSLPGQSGLRLGRGGPGGRSFDEDAGEGGAGADLIFGTVPAEVVLAAMVLVYPPTGFESAASGDFNGDDGWLGAVEKQSLALSTLC
jgi:hypothetical protein